MNHSQDPNVEKSIRREGSAAIAVCSVGFLESASAVIIQHTALAETVDIQPLYLTGGGVGLTLIGLGLAVHARRRADQQ